DDAKKLKEKYEIPGSLQCYNLKKYYLGQANKWDMEIKKLKDGNCKLLKGNIMIFEREEKNIAFNLNRLVGQELEIKFIN
ncbi:MAG: hypothetical protein JRI41_10295, partial [Deltaproteobacteria bacterium]|nr:hypothetical protein [Deltaproteobacteria bacterium]